MSRDCVVCGRKTYPASPRPSPEQRAILHAEGRRRVGGRGACVNCYQALRKAGRLEELEPLLGHARGPDDVDATPCIRCGVPQRRPEDLCSDCELVLADLGEIEMWAAS